MEELQKVRCRARRAFVRVSVGYAAGPGRSSRALPNSTRASPVADSRRADPRLSSPPKTKRERLEQMRKMGIGKFEKVREARLVSPPSRRNGRVLSADAKAGDGREPILRSSILASRRRD